jgi:hypothetical protein
MSYRRTPLADSLPKLRERKSILKFKPFPYELHLIFTSDVVRSIRKRYEGMKGDETTGAMTLHRTGGSLIIFDEETNINYIGHEVSHVVEKFMEFCGIKDGEVRAYYQGWLTHEVAKRAALDKPAGE